MQTRTIPASDLKPGDVLVKGSQRWRVDIAVTNPRLRFGHIEGDVLVDVNATGINFRVPCSCFSSYMPATMLAIEVP